MRKEAFLMPSSRTLAAFSPGKEENPVSPVPVPFIFCFLAAFPNPAGGRRGRAFSWFPAGRGQSSFPDGGRMMKRAAIRRFLRQLWQGKEDSPRLLLKFILLR
ncbi:MAG: hypothetical protein C6W57_09670 [Caldibacillus debilis]|nr:MAG: hypothetical protein C6W57_09670 [Caldibacillus debilis]